MGTTVTGVGVTAGAPALGVLESAYLFVFR